MLGGRTQATASAVLFAGVILCFALLRPPVARGADWKLDLGIGLDETFTDNVELAEGDDAERHSDLITRISPTVALRGQGGRSSAAVTYTLSQLLHRLNSVKDTRNNDLAATGQLEIWDRVAFIEGQASISREIVDGEAASSESVAGENVNRAEAKVFALTPILRHHFGSWVETEAKFNQTIVRTGSDEIDDTSTRSGQLRIASGRKFSLVPWSIDLLNSKTQNENDPSDRERRADLNLTYVWNSKFSLVGSIGWEDVENSDLDKQPKGLTWSAGFQLRPSRKTDLVFTFGDRNEERNIDFQARYRLSSRTFVSASYTQTIETSQGLLARNTTGLTVGPNGLPVNIEGEGSSSGLGLQDEAFRQDRFSLKFSGSRRLLTFSGDAYYERRDTEATNIIEKEYGGGLNLSRALSRTASADLGLSYSYTDFGTPEERTQNDIGVLVKLNYSLARDVELALAYNLTHRRVNNALADLTENSVTVGIQKRF